MLTVSYLLSHNLTSLITGALGHRLSLYPVVTPCALSSYLRCDPAVLLHEHPASGQTVLVDKPRSTLWLHTPQAVFLSELLAEYRHRQNLQNRYSCSSNHALHFRLAQGFSG